LVEVPGLTTDDAAHRQPLLAVREQFPHNAHRWCQPVSGVMPGDWID